PHRLRRRVRRLGHRDGGGRQAAPPWLARGAAARGGRLRLGGHGRLLRPRGGSGAVCDQPHGAYLHRRADPAALRDAAVRGGGDGLPRPGGRLPGDHRCRPAAERGRVRGGTAMTAATATTTFGAPIAPAGPVHTLIGIAIGDFRDRVRRPAYAVI